MDQLKISRLHKENPAIITVTFNPALDLNTSVEALLPERKLKCTAPVIEPGGGGINVARAINKLGGQALAIYPGGGDTGRIITQLLAAESVNAKMIHTKSMCRQNLIIVDRSSGKQYLFDMPGPTVSSAAYNACLNFIRQADKIDYLVVSGSLPNGAPKDLFVKLASIACDKQAKMIVDTSGEHIQLAVRAGVYLIKPNLKELGLLTGREIISATDAEDAARQVLRRFACEVVIVSMGSNGALLVTKDQALRITPPPVTVLSTVGAGDSLVGGLVLWLAQGKPLADAVKYAVACGTAATITAGPELCNKADADRLFSLVATGIITGSHLNENGVSNH